MATDTSTLCLNFGVSIPSAECASWVQAWGSIGAILATLLVLGISHLLNNAQREAEEKSIELKFLEGLFQLVGGVRGIAGKIIDIETIAPGTPHERNQMLAELEAMLGALQRIDISRLYKFELLVAAIAAESNVRMLIASIRYVASDQASAQLEKGYLAEVAISAMKNIEPHAVLLYQLVTERGAKTSIKGMVRK